MEIHEAATIFEMDEETIGALADDIKVHGLIDPIRTCDGKIIDGRRRFRACEIAGVEPRFQEVTPPDPIAYSWSLNGPRRTLTIAQRALAGAKMRAMYDEQAKERLHAAQERGRETQKGTVANLPQSNPDAGRTRDHVANVVGVGARTIDYATRVLREGTPEIIKDVEEGRLAVSKAAELVREERKEEEEPEPGEEESDTEDQPKQPERPKPCIGAAKAYEAINHLKQIARDDVQRKLAKKIILDYVHANL